MLVTMYESLHHEKIDNIYILTYIAAYFRHYYFL